MVTIYPHLQEKPWHYAILAFFGLRGASPCMLSHLIGWNGVVFPTG